MCRMICVGLGFAKVTPARPREHLGPPGVVPSVCLSAATHADIHLSLSPNGFPRFLMAAQPLFMSRGPFTKAVNAASKAQFTSY